MKTNFKLVTILGIPVEINLSWLIIFALVVLSLSRGYYPSAAPGHSSGVYLSVGIVSALLLFVCLLLHELSHSVVAKMNRLPIAGITLFVFGGVAHMKKEPQSPKVEFRMAIAGPLMSVALAVLFLTVKIFSENLGFGKIVTAMSQYLFMINSAIVVFNMVPGFPLDGGRILRAGLWQRYRDLKKATRIAANVGKGFSTVLMAWGVITFMNGNIIGGLWFIFIGIFISEAAELSYRQMLMKKVFAKLRAEDLMSTDVISVPAGETIEHIVNAYFLKLRHSCFPVIEDDRVIGVITFHDAKEIPKAEWNTKTAKDSCIPIHKSFIVKPDADLFDALDQISDNGIGRVLVIDHDPHIYGDKESKLVGILSRKDIFRLFKNKSNLDG